jgi:hypothetical protein
VTGIGIRPLVDPGDPGSPRRALTAFFPHQYKFRPFPLEVAQITVRAALRDHSGRIL